MFSVYLIGGLCITDSENGDMINRHVMIICLPASVEFDCVTEVNTCTMEVSLPALSNMMHL